MTTKPSPTAPLPHDVVTKWVASTAQRVARFEHQGQFYWVKQREELSLRMRLQKGEAGRAFENERSALRHLSSLGLPVPEIIAEGADFYITPDCGDTLFHVLLANTHMPKARLKAFGAAGKALATLHNSGLSHGRPAIRDFCWEDQKITLLDFERYAPRRNTTRGHVQDLVIFVFTALTAARGICPEIETAIAAYRTHDQGNIWAEAERFCQRYRWVNWATKPVQWRGAGKAKEFKTIPLLLDLFAGRAVGNFS